MVLIESTRTGRTYPVTSGSKLVARVVNIYKKINLSYKINICHSCIRHTAKNMVQGGFAHFSFKYTNLTAETQDGAKVID